MRCTRRANVIFTRHELTEPQRVALGSPSGMLDASTLASLPIDNREAGKAMIFSIMALLEEPAPKEVHAIVDVFGVIPVGLRAAFFRAHNTVAYERREDEAW